VVSVTAASNVTFQGLEIRYGRGAGVVVNGSTGVVLRGCTVADHGTIAVNITGGSENEVVDSDVHGGGDTGVALYGAWNWPGQPSPLLFCLSTSLNPYCRMILK